MFLPYLRKVLEFVRARFPDRTIELHIDNAKYHKQHTDYSQNLSSLNRLALKSWIMEFAPPEEGFDCQESFEDEDGAEPTKAQLLDLALQFQIDPLNKVEELVAEFGGKVEYTAPYWSMAQPMEDYFNNMWKNPLNPLIAIFSKTFFDPERQQFYQGCQILVKSH